MNKKIILLSGLVWQLIMNQSFAQITLDSCYAMSERNYPLVKKREIISQQSQLQTEVIKKNLLPQIGLNAQATYQSDVTHVNVSIPNFHVTSPNKDQYKSYLNVNQVLYDGGAINGATTLQETQEKLEQQAVTVSLYQVKNNVNDLFFTILLLQENEELLNELKENLLQKRKEVESAVKNGVTLQANLNLLDIEILKVDQKINNLTSDKKTILDLMSQFTGATFSNDTKFESPANTIITSSSLNRPELKLFDLQRQQIDAATALKDVGKKPTVAAFVQAGFGNPALNMLDNTFQGYYIAGLRLNWNVFDWNKTNKEQELLQVQKKIVDNEQEIFTFQTDLQKKKLNQEIEKIQETLKSDQQIINLRKQVVASYESQLNNQAITYTDYLNELTALKQAEIVLKSHEIELIQIQSQLDLLNGN